MRTPLRQAVLAGACIVIVSCSNPQAGPSLPEGAAAAGNASSALPPPVAVTQSSVPSASPLYPTGHPSLHAPSSTTNKTHNASATARTASTGKPADNSNLSGSGPKMDSDSNFDNLDVLDTSLKGKLVVLRVGSDPAENNLLSVFVGLKNKTSHPLALEVQTIYKDRLGNPLNDGSWVPMTLKPHEETEYRSASISTEATDFVVRIRRPSAAGAN